MKVLITGGAGMVGSHIATKLVENNHAVTILDDLSNGQLSNIEHIKDKIIFLKWDVSEKILDEKFGVIYHLACFPRSACFDNPKRDVKVNIIGIINVLELARKYNSKVIYSSNSGIYDTAKLPVTENTPDKPTSPYDIDKMTADWYCKVYGEIYNVPTVIFRFGMIYGPRQKLSDLWRPVVTQFVRNILEDKPCRIDGDGEQTRDFMFVEDVVEALYQAKDNNVAVGKTMILGTGIRTSINELHKTCVEVCGKNTGIYKGSLRAGDIKDMQYPSTYAQTILDWKPTTDIKTGIRKIKEWMENNQKR